MPSFSYPGRARRRLAIVFIALLLPLLGGAIGPRADFATRLLASQNQERARLGLPPLAWSDALADGARTWSDHLAATHRFEHSPDRRGDPRVGENIWGGTPGRFGPEAMIGLWLAEGAHFRPGTFPLVSTTGDVADVSHYTQVIWRDTRQVGCALSRGGDEDILVCRYSRAGNVIGSRPL